MKNSDVCSGCWGYENVWSMDYAKYGKYFPFEVPITVGLWRDAKQGWTLGLPWERGLTSGNHNMDLLRCSNCIWSIYN